MLSVKYGLVFCLILCLYSTTMAAEGAENDDDKPPPRGDDLNKLSDGEGEPNRDNEPMENDEPRKDDEPKLDDDQPTFNDDVVEPNLNASQGDKQEPVEGDEFNAGGDGMSQTLSETPEDENVPAMELGTGPGDVSDATHDAHLGSSAVHSFEQNEFKHSAEEHADHVNYAQEKGIPFEGVSPAALKKHVQFHQHAKEVEEVAQHHGVEVPAGGIKTHAHLKEVKGKIAAHVANNPNATPPASHVIKKAKKYGLPVPNKDDHKAVKATNNKVKELRKEGREINDHEAHAIHAAAVKHGIRAHDAPVPKDQKERKALKKAVVTKKKEKAKAERKANKAGKKAAASNKQANKAKEEKPVANANGTKAKDGKAAEKKKEAPKDHEKH